MSVPPVHSAIGKGDGTREGTHFRPWQATVPTSHDPSSGDGRVDGR